LILSSASARRSNAAEFQGHLDAAVSPHSFHDANAAVARDKGRRLLRIEGIDFAPNVAADLEYILKSCSGHERCFGELALEDRIGGDRRAMEQKATSASVKP